MSKDKSEDVQKWVFVNEAPRRKRSGYYDGLQILLFATNTGEFNFKRLK